MISNKVMKSTIKDLYEESRQKNSLEGDIVVIALERLLNRFAKNAGADLKIVWSEFLPEDAVRSRLYQRVTQQ
jgi:hypothetical protein